MTGVITRGNFPKLLWPGLNKIWGTAYNQYPAQWSQAFDDSKASEMAYEEDVEATGFGLASIKTEGGSISYDSHSQGPTTRYTHVTYALGFQCTREEEEDNKYAKVAKGRTRMLAFSMRQTKEIVMANIFNRAFNSSYTGGDGKEMVATDHPIVAGTQSNELSPAADLSEASLESMLVQIGDATNSRGLKIRLQGRKLIVPNALQFEAERILNSNLRPGTANNDVNAMRSMGKLPDGVFVWNYLTDTDAFFIKTDCPDSVKHFTRRAVEFKQDNDFDTENHKYKSTERYSGGWSDFRGIFGSEGV